MGREGKRSPSVVEGDLCLGGDSSWGSYVGGRLFDEFGGGGAGGGAGGHYVDASREVADVE